MRCPAVEIGRLADSEQEKTPAELATLLSLQLGHDEMKAIEAMDTEQSKARRTDAVVGCVLAVEVGMWECESG